MSKFYVFDNNSTTPLLDDVADFVKQGLVKYTWESGVGIENQQAWIYDRCSLQQQTLSRVVQETALQTTLRATLAQVHCPVS